MASKAADPIDKHVGARVRSRRTLIGMTQRQLAKKLGLTYQQIQKYEDGRNRIGASRLHQIATILEVPIHFFFQGAARPDTEPKDQPEADFPAMLGSAEEVQLVVSFGKIKEPTVRRSILQLVRAVGKGGDDGRWWEVDADGVQTRGEDA
jgi:transcriptional regulator with XRE-family HTH domain